MKLNHKKIQRELIDNYYSDADMSPELSEHLKTCSDCAAFWQGVIAVKDAMPELEPSTEADEAIIRSAFREAEAVMNKRRSMKDFMLFISMALAAVTLIFLFASRGYGMYLLAAQLFFLLLTPFAVPFIIKRRLTKEEC